MRSVILFGVALVLTIACTPSALGADEAKGPPEGRGGFMGRAAEAMPDVQNEFKALDADGDGQLSMREYARAVFARREFLGCDKDRDGKLTKDEFASFTAGAGMGDRAGQFRPEAMFERLDADKNGEVTEAEAGRGWRMLSRSDANGDGKVSKDEYAKAREQLQKDMATRRGEEFARLDTNTDGSLSFVELLARGGRRAETPKTEEGKNVERPKARQALGEQLLRSLDKNGDGKIAKDEWSGAEERFKAMDTNNDGVIDGTEIQARARSMGRRAEEQKKSEEKK